MFENLGRILSLLAAINAIIVVVATQLTGLLADYPSLSQVITILMAISAVITPFLPRVQGHKSEGK